MVKLEVKIPGNRYNYEAHQKKERWETYNDKKGHITKTSLFKHTENFTTKRNETFQIKILIFFIILLKT